MKIADVIDEKAESCGVSKKRRLQTRNMLSHISMRMAHQPPDLFFDELLTRCRKLATRKGTAEELENEMAARLGEKAFLERKERYTVMAHAWQERCGSKPPGTGVLTAGAICMGLGTILTLIAGILIAITGNPFMAIIFTPGGLLLIAGIVCLAVGAHQRSHSQA
jgi:hypothetical protein